jgi:methylenetetrahydrofolate reductase (NADPH)
MKVIDHIKEAKGTLISFEVLPPLKGKGIEALYKHLDPLMEFKPSYINVTYHRSEHVFKKRADGSFEKVIVRKRPGTESICACDNEQIPSSTRYPTLFAAVLVLMKQKTPSLT